MIFLSLSSQQGNTAERPAKVPWEPMQVCVGTERFCTPTPALSQVNLCFGQQFSGPDNSCELLLKVTSKILKQKAVGSAWLSLQHCHHSRSQVLFSEVHH